MVTSTVVVVFASLRCAVECIPVLSGHGSWQSRFLVSAKMVLRSFPIPNRRGRRPLLRYSECNYLHPPLAGGETAAPQVTEERESFEASGEGRALDMEAFLREKKWS